jgi:N-acetylglucosamine-6-phosphate deacetylase
MRRLLRGARIFTGDNFLYGHALLLDGRRILDLVPDTTTVQAEATELPAGSLLAPGFVDTQVNGGGGALFNDTPTADAIRTIVAAHRRFGTTSLLPTFITDATDRMHHAARAAAEVTAESCSGAIGVHLEGPFLRMERRGVHDASFVRAPEAADLAFLAGLPAQFPHGRVLLSLAPEIVPLPAIAALAAAGLRLAGAHSAATYDETVAAIAHGLTGFTHLFNAMPPIQNREPGIAGAAIDDPSTWCGLIADGVHVHPATMRLALAAKPRGKIMLVTDAMPPLGTDAESFALYGRTIHRRDGRLVTDDGVLAGADLDMAQAVRNCATLLGGDVGEALRMASLYPARFLGLDDRIGRLAPGLFADIVLLDPSVRVLGTWVGGDWRTA